MKTSFLSLLVPIACAAILVSAGCKKNDTTNASIPELSTSPVLSITKNTALSGGNISSDGGDAITARGICWSTAQNPTIANTKTSDGTGTGNFSSSLAGLSPGTTYYVRAYATNTIGTAYGSELTFSTLCDCPATLTDIDGNVYDCVAIGTQCWMAANLNVTHFRNGVAIPLITDNNSWIMASTSAYCNFNNNASNSTVYGRLYNMYTLIDSRNICPIGWHIPTDAEWTTLTDYLGGIAVAGGKLKETGISHWQSPNTGADNSSGFTALPGGYRMYDGSYSSVTIGNVGRWWSYPNTTNMCAYTREILYNGANIVRSQNCIESYGISIRCIHD